jgi:hypothetical protein
MISLVELKKQKKNRVIQKENQKICVAKINRVEKKRIE